MNQSEPSLNQAIHKSHNLRVVMQNEGSGVRRKSATKTADVFLRLTSTQLENCHPFNPLLTLNLCEAPFLQET